ncbi:MAG: 6-carboxytetrahydropterin synthase [Dehalococcoidia bacterium]
MPGANGEIQPRSGDYTCASCLAAFEWLPTTLEGQDFCCFGCSLGGPCNCTYTVEPPDPSDVGQPVANGEPGPKAETGRQSAAPQHGVVMAAVNELPAAIRPAVLLRMTRDASDREIGEELGLTPVDVENCLRQGQAILERTIGSNFRIEFMPPPDNTAEADETGRHAVDTAAQRGGQLTEAMTRSLSALSSSLQGEAAPSNRDTKAQKTISEALQDASEIFRLAAERLDHPNGHSVPLRRILVDRPDGELTLLASGVSDPAAYLAVLDALPQVQWVRVESVDADTAAYKVQAESVSALVCGLLSLGPGYRPQKLRLRADAIEVTVPATAPRAGSNGHKPGPVFELGADAFFGARHFVTMNGQQGPPHHHSYRVEVLVESPSQDSDGVVIGFREVRALVEAIVEDYSETLLNTVPPFHEVQPTSENIARVIFEKLAGQLGEEPIRLKQVKVWESPTNHASYSDAALATRE